MSWFARRRPKPAAPPAGPVVERRSQLAGVPHLNPRVETLYEKKKGFSLSWVNELPRQKNWLKALLIPPPRRHRLMLDNIGKRTIELIDGEHTIAQIAAQLADEFNLPPSETADALVTFIGQLMAKRVVTVVQTD